MRVYFKLTKNKETVPFNYQPMLTGLFHKWIDKNGEHEKYFQQLVVYIHNNPVYHGFVDHPAEYPWSSYLSCISVKPTKLQRETVIGWFDDIANFKVVHEGKVEYIKIGEWLGL